MIPFSIHRIFSAYAKYQSIWKDGTVEHNPEDNSRHDRIHNKPETHPQAIERPQSTGRYQTPSEKHRCDHPWLPRPIPIQEPRQYQTKETHHHRCKHPGKVSQGLPIELWYFLTHDIDVMTIFRLKVSVWFKLFPPVILFGPFWMINFSCHGSNLPYGILQYWIYC